MNENWRITFEFNGEDAMNVDYEVIIEGGIS